MGQRMENVGGGQRTSKNGYESQITYYQAKRCNGCPLLSACHNAKGNRRIEVNHRLNFLKQQAKEKLISEKGLENRSKRPIEAEAVFGQLKSNNKFNRFTFIGLEKVELEFLLMAIGHNFRKMAANITLSLLKSSKKYALISAYNHHLVISAESTRKNCENHILALLLFHNLRITT